MKRIVLVLALMTLLLLPAAVAGAASVGIALPQNAVEVETWYLEGTNWVYQGTGNVAALARCWRSMPVQGACNKQSWVVNVTHHASVAQWIEWSAGGTRWDWRIRKPGTYAADCIQFSLKSNNAVAIDYDGFADLQYLEQNEGIKKTIDTFYSTGESIAEAQSNGWVAAAALNNDDDLVPDSAALHLGLTWKLWNKIVVAECNSSCEYEDTATITLVLQNMKFWVDPETGYYKLNQETITPEP